MATAETIAPAKPPVVEMSLEDFLGWDGGGHQGKLELIDGVVRAMAPASEGHGTLQANLAGLLWQHLRGSASPCRVVSEAGIVPRFNPGHNVRVPDLVVTCTPPVKGARLVEQPLVLIEILSPGNFKETWESLRASSTIPSLREIIVVDSEKIHVQIFRKEDDGNWQETAEEIGVGGALKIGSLDAEFSIDDIYAGTALVGQTSDDAQDIADAQDTKSAGDAE